MIITKSTVQLTGKNNEVKWKSNNVAMLHTADNLTDLNAHKSDVGESPH